MSRWLATVVLLAATGLYVLRHPPENLALGHGVLSACPESFGDWNGTDLSFQDAVVEELKADDLLIRRYRRGGATVWLCMVYHQNRRFGAHDPRLCYQSQGYILEPGKRVRVDDGPAGETKVLASVNIPTGMGGIFLYAGTGDGLQRNPDCF